MYPPQQNTSIDELWKWCCEYLHEVFGRELVEIGLMFVS